MCSTSWNVGRMNIGNNRYKLWLLSDEYDIVMPKKKIMQIYAL